MRLEPLWTPDNQTMFSSVFAIPSGQVALLYAVGLLKEKYRTGPQIVVPQTVCIRRLLHEYKRPDPADLPCGWIYNIDTVKATEVADTIIQTCGLPWQLTMCRNVGIIGLPGTYRLELNDSTAIGVAQVYAELLDGNAVPLQTRDLFF